MRRKVLVTGGSGFIGTHLTVALAGQGCEVISLDLVPPKSPRDNVRFVQGDIRDPEIMRTHVDECDIVFHLAAIANVPMCQQHPMDSYRTNLLATLTLLDAASDTMKRTGRRVRIVFTSSCAVYGELAEARAAIESSPGTDLRSFYAAQKLGSEQMIRIFRERHPVPAVILRLFNVYGPGQDPNSGYSGVITLFRESLKQRRPLLLNGDGSQTRDFVSVHDVVRALLLAQELDSEKCDGEAINIGTGVGRTIKEIAETMRKVSNRSAPIQFVGWREGDTMHSKANIDRASRVLGWMPQVTLENGLRELFFEDGRGHRSRAAA